MLRFTICWLLAFTGIVVLLLAISVYDTQNAYFITCICLPLFFALLSRFASGKSHLFAISTAMCSAIILGATLMAYGSYYHTFIKPSIGFLVGGGWESVAAATIVGGMAGAISGLSAILIYSVIAWLIHQITGNQNAD